MRLYISSSIALDDRQSNSRRDKVSPVSAERERERNKRSAALLPTPDDDPDRERLSTSPPPSSCLFLLLDFHWNNSNKIISHSSERKQKIRGIIKQIEPISFSIPPIKICLSSSISWQ